MKTRSFIFGNNPAGQPVPAATLINENGTELTVIGYGASIQRLCFTDKQGIRRDVTLGYETLAEYEANNGNLGAVPGRFANRIAGAAFTLNGKAYTLDQNNGNNSLHGGALGYSHRYWDVVLEGETILCTLFSPDGDGGYPGNLRVKVIYSLSEEDVLTIHYEAVSDADTIINLTNHAYFNLNGEGTVENHLLQMNASRFTEVYPDAIPTGRLLKVENTPFDFRAPKPVGRDMNDPYPQMQLFGGYDHNFCLDNRQAAVLTGDLSGISMTVITDMPGMQVYTANGLSERAGLNGTVMGRHDGICLETQLYPDSIHHESFPTCVLKANTLWTSETSFAFRK